MQRHKPTGELFLPLSRATVQMWGIEQAKRSVERDRTLRRPVRAALRWIASTLRP
jgi:hypothetical protein